MDNLKEALEKSYETLRPFSDKYRNDFRRFLISLKLLASKTKIEGKKILDVGSGIGIMVSALNNLGGDASGVDKFIFPEESENFYSIEDFNSLKDIWEKKNIKIINADISAEKLPFDDGQFDIVICDATIEHLNESPKRLFREVNRILKNGGLFLVTTPNFASLLKRLRFLFGRSPNWDINDFFKSGSNFRGHRREFTISEIIRMLEWSSFEIIKKKTKNIFFNLKKLFSLKKSPAQICGFLSYPFLSMRDMIYVVARKK